MIDDLIDTAITLAMLFGVTALSLIFVFFLVF